VENETIERRPVAGSIKAPRKLLRSAYPLLDQYWRAADFVRKKSFDRRSEVVASSIIESMDKDAFDEIYRKHSAYFKRQPYSKYLNARFWLSESANRYFRFAFHELPPGRKFLDIGSGGGYFLAVCRQMGHSVTGLDTKDWPLFDDLIDYFGIDRTIHRIEPGVPLPRFEQTFDVVTAFMTGFNKRTDGFPWNENEWVPFLRDLRQYIAAGGRFVIKFNANKKTGEFYPKTARSAIERMPEYESSFHRDTAQLLAV
jgi:SAM-dependent methyltransferase